MRRGLFIRNLRADELFERFFISAVSSLLLLRFYLFLAGYPQVGGGNLHIAHMLWGGALMVAAFVIVFGFLGSRAQKLAAVIGGIGFGIFIDEIGKFLTKDNDYFFRPAIGIIYAIFVVLYLVVNFLGRRSRLTPREYQLNALVQLEEVVLHDLEPSERRQAEKLLRRADQADPVTKGLKELLATAETIAPDAPNLFERWLDWLRRRYQKAWQQRHSDTAVKLFFAIQAIIFMVAVVVAIFDNLDDVRHFVSGKADYGQSLVVGQLAATLVATVYVVIGVIRLTRNRRQGLEFFRKAILVNLLLTEFFVFSRIQFGAMPGFIFNLVLLALINFSLHQERRR